MHLRSFVVATLLLVSGVLAHATPVVYTQSAYLSGSLGASTFTNTLVSFIEVSDTASILNFGSGVYTNPGGFSTVTVQGLGSAILLNSSFGAVAEALGGGEEAIGFFDGSSSFSIAEYSAALPGYDLAESATVAGFLGITSLVPEATSSGNLVISALDAPGAAFYTATVTPEPGTFALFGTGLFGLTGVLRRRLA